jgi:hypothetical protein
VLKEILNVQVRILVNEEEGAIAGGDERQKVVVLPFQRGGWWTSGVGRERALVLGGEKLVLNAVSFLS